MKISWMSNAPWLRSGYGNQTALFTPRLQAAGHELAITAFAGLDGGMLNIGGIPIYPRGNTAYGIDVMSPHAKHFGADIIITLIDAWVMRPDLNNYGIPWVPWFPVDMEPLPPPVARQVKQGYKRIVFSKFGKKMVEDAGMDCYYVPHGVDTNTFKPVDRVAARKAIGVPDSAFLVGMVAANKGNPSRKAFAQQLEAFATFKKKHNDAMLYLHTAKAERGENDGVNLPELCRHLGLVEGTDVLFCNQYQNLIGYPEEYMTAAYSAMDVHMLVSMGEGFGIPILEAQACGCPVLVGDWTSMSELCFSGWKVDKKDSQPWWTPLASYQFSPNPAAIVDKLNEAYNMRGNQDYRDRARAGAMAYDADKVTEKYWLPVLESIGDQLADDSMKIRKVIA